MAQDLVLQHRNLGSSLRFGKVTVTMDNSIRGALPGRAHAPRLTHIMRPTLIKMALIQSPNASEMANDERAGLQNAYSPQEDLILTPLEWGQRNNSQCLHSGTLTIVLSRAGSAFRWVALVHASETILYASYMSATGAHPLPLAGWRTTSILSRD